MEKELAILVMVWTGVLIVIQTIPFLGALGRNKKEFREITKMPPCQPPYTTRKENKKENE